MSAETLRRAASLMRERAEEATEGPWTTWADPKPGIDKAAVETAWTRGDPDDGGSLVTDWCDLPDAEHIASWHPAVALAVADWLDATAARIEEIHEALTVARAYLGESA